MEPKIIKAKALSKVQDAEGKLASFERKDDLADLPPGHPILVAMEESKRRLEERQKLTEEIAERTKTREELKVKKQTRKSAKEEKAEVDRREKILREIKDYNENLDTLALAVEKFGRGEINKFREAFKGIPTMAVRVQKVERLLIAFHGGLMSFKIANPNLTAER